MPLSRLSASRLIAVLTPSFGPGESTPPHCAPNRKPPSIRLLAFQKNSLIGRLFCRQQLDEGGFLFRPGDKIQRPEIMVPIRSRQSFVSNDFDEQGGCLFCTGSPNDITASRAIALIAGSR